MNERVEGWQGMDDNARVDGSDGQSAQRGSCWKGSGENVAEAFCNTWAPSLNLDLKTLMYR